RAGATAKTIAPHLKKAIELTGRARHLIERGLRSRIGSTLTNVQGDASSRAKTQDLNRPTVSPSPESRAGATVESSPSSTVSRSQQRPYSPSAQFNRPNRSRAASNGAGAVAGQPGAKLVARGEDVEFGIFGARVVIGRSHDGSDELDIDLKPLTRGAER